MKCAWVVIAALIFSNVVAAQKTSQPRSGKSTQQKANGTVTGPDVLITVHGSLVLNTSKKLSVADADSDKDDPNVIDFFLSKKIEVLDGDKKLKPSDLKVGAPVAVDARRLLDGSLEAITVRVDHGK
jgi:hypothetical protein